MKRRGIAVLFMVLLAILGLVAPVFGVVSWVMVGSPLAATVFQSTTYTFTATNLAELNGVGCVEIDLPVEFVIEGLGTPVASNGYAWSSVIYSGTNWVLVSSNSGGGRLDIGQSVTFTVQAQATQPGAYDWINHTHRRNDCTGTQVDGLPWAMVVAPVIVPTPLPTLIPTPLPSLVPSPLPTVVPTAIPSVIPIPTKEPVDTPAPTQRPTASPSPTPRETVVAAVLPAAPPPGGSAAAPVARIASFNDTEGGTSAVSVGTEVFAFLDGPLVWFVPGAVVGVPGLLVLLFIGLQALGALAWVPAVRRMSGEPMPVRRRRRPGQAVGA